MPRFKTFDGLQMSYETEGSGYPALLLHGFASDSFIQWIRAGFADKVAATGRRAVMLDLRGHGMSAKPHEPESYGDGATERDAGALLDHLEIDQCDVIGYSMGAWIALRLVVANPGRFRSLVLGGIGRLPTDRGAPSGMGGNPLSDAMLTEDPSSISNPVAKSFRDYADTVGGDRKALAAFQSAPRSGDASLDLSSVSVPVLVIAAEGDPLAPDPAGLAAAIPGATSATVPGRHLNVVNNPAYHDAVVQFLAGVG